VKRSNGVCASSPQLAHAAKRVLLAQRANLPIPNGTLRAINSSGLAVGYTFIDDVN